MAERDYRRMAIELAAQRSCRPSGYTLFCADRCGAKMSAAQRDTILSLPRAILADRAYCAGWDLTSDGGDLLCPACFAERAKRG